METEKSLTPPEVAEILSIAKNTVYELIKRGELSAYRIGKKVRIEPKDVEAYKQRTKNSLEAKKPGFSNRYSTAPQTGDLASRDLIISGQDVMLDILSRTIDTLRIGIHPLRSHQGSYNGLFALYQGLSHAATAHLWDGDTDTYNIPYVRRMLPGTPSVIIHLACRMQGFFVAKGNPKEILSWNDLKRSDITIINREKGSGTRVLLDEKLRILGIYGSSIAGYEIECVSHLAVASAVARGTADLGLGNEKSALQVKGIDFVAMQKERYELVIRKEDMRKKGFSEMIDIIRSDEFRAELDGIGGYDCRDTGKITEL